MIVQLAHEFKFTNRFNSIRQDMVNDFLKVFEEEYKVDFFEKKSPEQRHVKKEKEVNTVGWWSPIHNSTIEDPWKVKAIKHTNPEGEVFWDSGKSKFPTALNLIESFGEDCPIGTYSLLEAHTEIDWHTGIENRQCKYARCHIPLIVPEGDIALEIGGHIVRWDNCLAFNNQILHRAWNKTDFRRLVFTLDLERSVVDWPAPEADDFCKSI